MQQQTTQHESTFELFDITQSDIEELQAIRTRLSPDILEWVIAQLRAEVEPTPWYERLGLTPSEQEATWHTMSRVLRLLIEASQFDSMYAQVVASSRLAYARGVRVTEIFQASNKLEAVLTGLILQLVVEPDEQTVALATLGKFLKSLMYVAMDTYRMEDIRLIELHQEELEKAQAQAIEANKTKSIFLANVSHELRTPLNAIIGYSEMLIEDAEEQPQMKKDLNRIRSAGVHLLELINGILDISKIEAGRMELYLETSDVAPLCAEVVTTVRPVMARNENRLEVGLEPNLGSMKGDLTKLRQVLLNLLSNAAKFTDRGVVRFSARRDGHHFYFNVADNGIGIAPEHMGKLFVEFSQADASTTRKYGGTGLGLAISQKFCQMMGGHITVQSKPYEGSTFTVRVPAVVVLPEE